MSCSPSSRVFVFYLFLVSVGILWPMMFGVIGSDHGDTYKHVWSFWHTDQTLFHGWPWTNRLSTPHGGFLLDVMFAPSLLFLPCTWIFGPIATSQIFILISLWCVGWSVFTLARFWKISNDGAFAAGVLAQTSPYLLGYPLASGVYERISIWIFPFLWLMLLRYRAERHWKWVFYGCLSLLFMAFSCQTYVVYAMMMLGLGWMFFRDRATLLYTCAMTVVVLAAFLYIRQITQSSWTLAPQPMRFSIFPTGPLIEEATTLSSLFSPFFSRAQQGVQSGDWLLRLCYIGWLPMGICLWAYKEIPKQLLLIAFVFLILSLGSTIVGPIPNPFYWILAHTLPIYGSIPDVFQQIAVVMPFLSLGIVFALQKYRVTMRWMVVGLILLERMFALPHSAVWQSAPLSVPSVYEKVENGAIIDIPRQLHGEQLVSAKPFLYQQSHHQALAISVYMGVTGWDAYAPIALGSSTDWEASFSCMRKGGLRWVMIHTNWYPTKTEGMNVIDQISLSATASDGVRYLYDLSTLSIQPLEDVYLPPRNTGIPEVPPSKSDIPLDMNIFSMVQRKCPIDSAAQHHQVP